MMRGLYIFVSWFAAFTALQGQTLVATLSKNPVNENERFRLEYTFYGTGSATNFTAPSLKDFTVLSGPIQYSQTSITSQGVQVIPSVYFYLSCAKTGTYTIGTASVELNGKTIKSAELKLTVNPAPVQAAASVVSLRCQPARSSCMSGEMVNCKIQVVSSAEDLYSISKLQAASDNNAEVSAVTMNQSVTKSLESINGVQRYVYDVGSMNITPKKEGKISIPAASIDAVILRRQKFSTPFSNDPFFTDENMALPDITVQVPTRMTLKSDANFIQVSSAPVANRPSNYAGAVGNDLALSLSLDRNTLHTNEALTFNVRVSGEGGTNSIQPPQLNLPKEFETYPPNISDSVSGNYSSRNFQYVAVPRSEGNYTIPAANISYYDANKKDYVHLVTPEVTVNVVKPGTPIAEVSVTPLKAATPLISGDLLPLKTSFSGLGGEPLFGSSLFVFLLAVPLLFFAFIVFRKQLQLEKARQSHYIPPPDDQTNYEGTGDAAPLTDTLEQARILAGSGDMVAFCAALEKGIIRHFARKTGTDAASVSVNEICQLLEQKNAEASQVEAIRSLLGECAMVRFGGMNGPDISAEEMLRRADECIETADRILA